MALLTRRKFLWQSALAIAASCTGRLRALAERDVGPLDQEAIRKLAAAIRGDVITPTARDYEAARLVFNRAVDLHPAVIVRCAAGSDVARALEFARIRNLPIAVRGGGHSRAGLSVCDKGVVIDVSPMKQVQVDAAKEVGHAEAGVLVGEMDAATARFSLATPAGGCPNVGMSGFTLGGGEGLLMPMYGASCDNLLSANLVLPDGREVRASPESNPDLFWAIRGGGGNFGIATAFEYRLHSVGNVQAGALVYPPGHVADLLHGFSSFNKSAPDEMAPLGELLPWEKGVRFVNHICYFGPGRTARDLLKPVRLPLKPESDDVKEMPFFTAQAAGFRPRPFAFFQSCLFLPRLAEPEINIITAAVNNAPAQFRVLLIGFNGAITRVGVTETAFALREPGVEVDMLASWNGPDEKLQAIQWVKSLRDSLKPYSHGTYVSQLGETSEELVRTAYGPNYARLAQLKRKYDPENVLRLNQNVRPA